MRLDLWHKNIASEHHPPDRLVHEKANTCIYLKPWSSKLKTLRCETSPQGTHIFLELDVHNTHVHKDP